MTIECKGMRGEAMDKICLPSIVVWACHGVYPQEKKQPQQFVISLEMSVDLAPAGRSDDLSDTVDYGALYMDVESFVQNNTFELMETLAAGVANVVLQQDRVEEVVVRIEKSAAKTQTACFPAVVEITRRRV